MAKEEKEVKAAKEKKPDAAAQPPGADAPAKKKRSKWLLPAVALVVVLAGAGGGVWYWLRAAPAGDHAASAKETPKPKPADEKPPIFVALEALTVNLQPEAGDHLLQTTFSLKVADATVEQALKLQMPEIRSRLLLLLSSKRPSELVSMAGKQQLASQIAAEVNHVLHPEAADPAAVDKPAETVVQKAPEQAAEKAPEKAPEKAAEPAVRPAAAPGPVLSVFFTSFIIQ